LVTAKLAKKIGCGKQKIKFFIVLETSWVL